MNLFSKILYAVHWNPLFPGYIKICITYNYVLTIPYYQQIVNINIVYSNYIYELCIFISNISIDILYNISYPNIERRIT